MNRNATLDYARPIAAIGIIIFHTGGMGSSIGYAALPFFLILLVFLAFPAASKQPFPAYARTRAARLLRPWVVWSGVYGALKLAEIGLTGKSLSTEFAPWMLLAGPAIHLWFLPFACAACLTLWPLAQGVSSLSWGAQAGVSVFCAGLAVLLVLVQQGSDLPWPFAQWAFAAPAVALGAAFAVTGGAPPERQSLRAAAIAAGTAMTLWLVGWPPGSEQLVLAGGALALCLAWRLPDSRMARIMAEMALTLYLAHPLVVSVLLRVTPLPARGTATALATVCGTILLTLVLRRVRLARSATTS